MIKPEVHKEFAIELEDKFRLYYWTGIFNTARPLKKILQHCTFCWIMGSGPLQLYKAGVIAGLKLTECCIAHLESCELHTRSL